MKICSLYGVGFYYIPGTDMCLKVGGWARFETGTGYNGSFTTGAYFNNYNNRSTVNWHTRVKGTATFDARSSTEYGTVRSYIAIGISTNNTSDNPISAGYANRWFIQWAGFTIGHSTSFYRLLLDRRQPVRPDHRVFGLGRRRLGRVRLYRAVRQRPVGHHIG